MTVDTETAREAIATFLRALGHPETQSGDLAGTPERVVSAFVDELLVGYAVDIPGLLDEATPLDGREARGDVIVQGISTATVCPHHLMPAVGNATVAYRPGDRVLGIGTVARLVDAFARRLTLQETIGENVVATLTEAAGARFAVCRLEMLHTCLAVRGARKPEARVVTIARRGPVDEATLLTLARESR